MRFGIIVLLLATLLISVYVGAVPICAGGVTLEDKDGDIARPYADVLWMKVEISRKTLIVTIKLKEVIEQVPKGVNWLGYDVLISVNKSGSNFWGAYPDYYFYFLLDYGAGEGQKLTLEKEISLPILAFNGATPSVWAWRPTKYNFTLIIKRDGTMIWKVPLKYIGNPSEVSVAFATTVGSENWSKWENDLVPDWGKTPVSVSPTPWFAIRVVDGITVLHLILFAIGAVIIYAILKKGGETASTG